MDAEFVLGGSARGTEAISERPEDAEREQRQAVTELGLLHRDVDMYMLDFDKASSIEMTEGDVKRKLVPAFLGNDPYYPLPEVDEDLWDAFCDTYVQASKVILEVQCVEGDVLRLPRLFLEEVVKVLKENESWNAEDSVVFA